MSAAVFDNIAYKLNEDVTWLVPQVLTGGGEPAAGLPRWCDQPVRRLQLVPAGLQLPRRHESGNILSAVSNGQGTNGAIHSMDATAGCHWPGTDDTGPVRHHGHQRRAHRGDGVISLAADRLGRHVRPDQWDLVAAKGADGNVTTGDASAQKIMTGVTTVNTDGSGNGTTNITFGYTFATAPQVFAQHLGGTEGYAVVGLATTTGAPISLKSATPSSARFVAWLAIGTA